MENIIFSNDAASNLADFLGGLHPHAGHSPLLGSLNTSTGGGNLPRQVISRHTCKCIQQTTSGFQLELAYNLLQKKKTISSSEAFILTVQYFSDGSGDYRDIHMYLFPGCLLLNLLVIMGLLPLSSNVETKSRHRQTIRFLISTARNCRQDSQATFQHSPFNIDSFFFFSQLPSSGFKHFLIPFPLG